MLGEPHESTTPRWESKYEEFKEIGREDIEVGGRKLPCRVVDATCASTYVNPEKVAITAKTKYTVWFCEDLKECDHWAYSSGTSTSAGDSSTEVVKMNFVPEKAK
ncbi:MAG: hypothetical protein FD180_801 [Planctomycetota bacterium]|nr:MAG: hypothetical protein FD180_801 [Planctomycetota bacterium]